MCDILRTTKLFWAEVSKVTNTSFTTPVQMQVSKETQSFTSALQGGWEQAWQCGPEEGSQPTLCEALEFENYHCKEEESGETCIIKIKEEERGRKTLVTPRRLLTSTRHNTNSNKSQPKVLYAKSNHL